MAHLAIAFKEWAVICRALAEGRQSLILRKGGIAEGGDGHFHPEHSRFWLYPTFFHEHRAGIRPEMEPLFAKAEADRPPPGVVRVQHYSEVAYVSHVSSLDTIKNLKNWHAWTDAVIEQRFHYRTPGLYVLMLRVFRLPMPVDIAERPEYAGCKTWVTLDQSVSTDHAIPVVDEAAHRQHLECVKNALGV